MFDLFARTSKFPSTRASIGPRRRVCLTEAIQQRQQLFTAAASNIPAVMLLGNYGASTLGKSLRRPRNFMTTMSSIEKDSATTPTEMRSTAARLGGRALSTPARAASSSASSRTWSPNNGIVFSGTWSPNHGIVFRPTTGTPRSMSTNSVEGMKQEHLLQSKAEDNYVMASADPDALELQSTTRATATAAAGPKNTSTRKPKTSNVQKDLGLESPISRPEPVVTKQNEPLQSAASKTKTPKAAKSSERKPGLADPVLGVNVSEIQAPEQNPEPEQENPALDELPQTTTKLKMTEELFRAAKNAEPGSMDSYWSHQLYRGPLIDGKPQKTMVHYCKSVFTTERVLQHYFANSKVIGFDIEWKENSYRNSDARQNVSLIQIANEERIALFHVALYPKKDLVSPTFKKIMEDSSVTKVGVSIKADCTRLRKYLGIDSKGIFELSHLYKLVKFSETKEFSAINRRLVSLAKQTHEHLHLPMYKGDVRISDWSKKLSLEQIMYAASDSYAGLQLFHTLEMKRLALDPTPPRPYHAELNLPIRIAEGVEIPSDADAEDAEPEPETDDAATKTSLTANSKSKKLSEKELEEAKESVSMEDPELEYALSGYPLLPSYSDSNSDSDFKPDIQKVPSSLTRKTGVSNPPFPPPRPPPALFSSYSNPLVHTAEVLTNCHLDLPQNDIPKRRLKHVFPHVQLSPQIIYRLRSRNLRAYFLWHDNPGLSLKEVGAMLRSPPVSEKNVAVQILEAISAERLEFENERLRVVFDAWRRWGNRWLVGTRFAALEKACGYIVADDDDGNDDKAGGGTEDGIVRNCRRSR